MDIMLDNFEKTLIQVNEALSYPETPNAKNEGFHHSHNMCEIYFNLSGDVSFMVEGNIYPIKKGSIIITKPNELHHCVYNSAAAHKHYWVLFSCKNEKLLSRFLDRKNGEKNLIQLGQAECENFIRICDGLKNCESVMEQYKFFFDLLTIVNEGKIVKNYQNDVVNPEVKRIIEYVHKNIADRIKIGDIAAELNVSVNTLERIFKGAMKITLSDYIMQLRITMAHDMLIKGASVQEASDFSGFSSCSRFIAAFKKVYGKTPFQYRKNY